MDSLEKICNDKNAWVNFYSDEDDILRVYARCQCGRYLKHGNVNLAMTGHITMQGWICNRCGEVEPLLMIKQKIIKL